RRDLCRAGLGEHRLHLRQGLHRAFDATLHAQRLFKADGRHAGRRESDVLLVEDNRVNQIVFSQILEGLGLSWRLATSGEEALRLFVEQAPSVVLLDTTLADIDGFEVARRMRDLSGEKRIPVVGVITHAFEGDLDKCLASGMEDMLLKPVSPDMVEAVFVRLFGKDVLQLQA
ncbi:MAG: response regulator, partial [Rhizobium pusense]|nr:response regulator [Agrobacterium pusense]